MTAASRCFAAILRRLVLQLGCLVAPLLYALPAAAADAPVVVTHEGRLAGLTSGKVEQFLGIPFARKPRRWEAARPHPRWRGIRSAAGRRPGCAAPESGDGPERFDEDCLYLDVYRPKGAEPGARLPVIVFFHGGGNTSGTPAIYDGNRMAGRGNAIVVIPAYRLGVFGFLALDEAPADTGSAALSDQVAALRWTRRNIEKLGGDPSRVTVAGESAGAADVCALLAAPAARGLFSRAIMQSGFCHVRQSIGEARRLGTRFATAAGCDSHDALACLRRIPARTLMVKWSQIWAASVADKSAPLFPVTPFGTPTMPNVPLDAARVGTMPGIPVLVGFDQDETRSFLGGLWPLGEVQYRERMSRAYPGAELELDKLYPASEGRWFDALAAMRSDQLIICPSLDAAGELSARGPVAVFEFADRTAPAFRYLGNQSPHRSEFVRGASHTVELQYLFGYRAAGHALDAAQEGLADEMVMRWTQFAAGVDGKWPRYDPASHRATRIVPLASGGFLPTTDLLDRHRCAFWRAHEFPVAGIVP